MKPPRLTIPVTLPEPTARIGLGEPLLSIGSCFADFMARHLADHHFPGHANPTGILYNPLSITALLQHLLDQTPYRQDELFCHQGLWHSPHHHGSFSHPDREHALAGMNHTHDLAATALPECKWLLITLGTAWAWFPTADQTAPPVANCHRLPPDQFNRRLLQPDEIVSACRNIIRQFNAETRFIFTISPIRHRSATPPENSLAKAPLHLAVHQLVQEFTNVAYFPAYEIMLDELRDYRFYEADLLHPNHAARQIILHYFVNNHLDQRAADFLTRATEIRQAENHRPLHPQTPAADKFSKWLQTKQTSLQQDYPEIF